MPGRRATAGTTAAAAAATAAAQKAGAAAAAAIPEGRWRSQGALSAAKHFLRLRVKSTMAWL